MKLAAIGTVSKTGPFLRHVALHWSRPSTQRHLPECGPETLRGTRFVHASRSTRARHRSTPSASSGERNGEELWHFPTPTCSSQDNVTGLSAYAVTGSPQSASAPKTYLFHEFRSNRCTRRHTGYQRRRTWRHIHTSGWRTTGCTGRRSIPAAIPRARRTGRRWRSNRSTPRFLARTRPRWRYIVPRIDGCAK